MQWVTQSGSWQTFTSGNIGPDKIVYNEIFLIVSYKYKYNGFLWLRDITFNVYAAILIWSICCEDIKFESDKEFLQLGMMGLSTFMNCYIWPSAYLVLNNRGSARNVFPPIHIWSFGRARSYQSIYNVPSSYRCACAGPDWMKCWCTPQEPWIFHYVQVQYANNQFHPEYT